ncbi:MAG TPA: hypothetical protein VGI54_03860, partial [Solirubrobacteraceae bacterium]
MTATIGQPLSRVDGHRKVTGAATSAAEFAPAGLAHATLVQSRIARGRITEIDTADALAAPGVVAVVTHETGLALSEPEPKGFFSGELRVPLSDERI